MTPNTMYSYQSITYIKEDMLKIKKESCLPHQQKTNVFRLSGIWLLNRDQIAYDGVSCDLVAS